MTCDEEWTQIWETLRECLSEHGYTLWDEEQPGEYSMKPGCDFTLGKLPELKMGSSFGFQYVHPDRTSREFTYPGNMADLCHLQYRVCTSFFFFSFFIVIESYSSPIERPSTGRMRFLWSRRLHTRDCGKKRRERPP